MGNARKWIIIGITAALTVAAATAATAASKRANGGSGGGVKPSSATGTFSLRLLDSTDGAAHYGQRVTFDVTSSAAYPMVTLTCYQDGNPDWVNNQTVGFYPGWVWSQDFPLSSWKWTGGAADCKATLYYQTNKGNQTLDTKSFHVEA